jgi:hypothetical protein
MEDAKARLMLNANEDAEAVAGARTFFMQKERVLNKTKVRAFVLKAKRGYIPFAPSSSVTVKMVLEAGSCGYTEHKYINPSSIQTRAKRKEKRTARQGRDKSCYYYFRGI